MKITIKVPGSCGEIIQGMFHNTEPFLMTCPINLFSTVTISDEFHEMIGLGWKVELMIKKVLQYLECNKFNFGVEIKSALPRGKGMASSSADLAAAAKAVSLSLGFDLSAIEIAKLATTIEPTDGIFFDRIVSMNPLNGEIFSEIKNFREYKIAVFDFGGKIDTINVERRSDFCVESLPKMIDFDLMIKSALFNQKFFYKPELEKIIDFALKFDALGLNVAHTGTVAGIFFDESMSFKDIESIAEIINKKFPHIKFLTTTKLISGGFY